MSSLQRQSASQNYTPAMEEGGACEAPEQEFGHATVLDSDLSDREGQVREATENLGEVESLDGGFTQYAGGLVDALLPNEGDKAKLQINVNVPVAAGGAVRASFEFMVQAERDENGIKGRIQFGGGVTATVRGRVFFATVEAFAQAQVYGYMEALGSGGAQMFDHVLLGIQQRIAGVSSNIADAMFSRQRSLASVPASQPAWVRRSMGRGPAPTRASTGQWAPDWRATATVGCSEPTWARSPEPSAGAWIPSRSRGACRASGPTARSRRSRARSRARP